jgi:hypothetical protein
VPRQLHAQRLNGRACPVTSCRRGWIGVEGAAVEKAPSAKCGSCTRGTGVAWAACVRAHRHTCAGGGGGVRGAGVQPTCGWLTWHQRMIARL